MVFLVILLQKSVKIHKNLEYNYREMEFKRDKYLNKLIQKIDNGMVKIITGIRRCGKTYLLFNLFYKYLLSTGIEEHQIIKISLEGFENKELRNMDKLMNYINNKMNDKKSKYFILIDEVQNIKSEKSSSDSMLTFHFLLMDLMKKADVYVTGSNSKMLSSEVITEFRGRGDEVRVHPLSFKEYFNGLKTNKNETEILNEYKKYGGMPQIAIINKDDKEEKLKNIFNLVYIKDIIDRNSVRKDSSIFIDLFKVVASSIGSLTNPLKISNTFESRLKIKIDSKTIKNYLKMATNAFIISEVEKINIKGRKYIGSPNKYYFEDVGLRNSILDFSDNDQGHIMENIIYNELISRGFDIKVGILEMFLSNNGNNERTNYEIDFIAKKGNKQFYIQSTIKMNTNEEVERETRGLKKINDSFKKIVVVEDNYSPYYNENGILIIGLKDFLLDESVLE